MQILTEIRRKDNLKQQTLQWFLRAFAVVTIAFVVLLIPSLLYARNTFRELQLEKYHQRLTTGTKAIEESIDATLYVAQTLSTNNVFRPLRYKSIDYKQVTYKDRMFMKSYMDNLLKNEELTAHVALMLKEDVAVSRNQIFFENGYNYYPSFFCVNDYTFEEWKQVLAENQYGFLSASYVKNYGKSYDALIYGIKWGNTGYMYACFDTEDIKDLFVLEEEQGECFVRITRNTDDTILYEDLPEKGFEGEMLTSHVDSGNLKVEFYVGYNVLNQKMQPLFLWLIIYVVLCILMIVLISVGGTYFITYPLTGLLDILDKYKGNASKNDYKGSVEQISNSILAVETDLQNYKEMILVQQKRLRIRYLEKALNGQLLSQEDATLFRSCFPDFPEDGYYVFRIRLWTTGDETDALYQEAIQLLNFFIEKNFACFYLQEKISDTELILIARKADFEECCENLKFLVCNINQEEKYYELKCYVSNEYRYLENLSSAYAQVCNMEDFTFSAEQSQVCMLEEGFETMETQPFVTRFMSFYTAVSCGNKEMALDWIHTYSEELKTIGKPTTNKCVYQMICSILNCIKLERIHLLVHQDVPAESLYKKMDEGASLESLLIKTVSAFCDKINIRQRAESDNFAQDLVAYIDEHYMDCDICINSLADYFERSPSTVRKVFKNAMNITVASYIEQKRMQLANELLVQKNKTIGEVALECGYVNANSFYKAYRRVYGYAPSMLIGNTEEEWHENDYL